MKLNVYTIFDKIDGCASTLQLHRSDDRVVRQFMSSVRSRNKELESKGFPPVRFDDFELRKVATFDDETCVVEPILPPLIVPFVDN